MKVYEVHLYLPGFPRTPAFHVIAKGYSGALRKARVLARREGMNLREVVEYKESDTAC